MADDAAKISILFVCMGNICRSPTAHGVFRQRVAEAGLGDVIEIESAGTHGYHLGRGADRRAREAALERGYGIDDLRARQVEAADFERFDYILAMDRDNLSVLESQSGTGSGARVSLFLDFVPDLAGRDVPDPYYGGLNGFEEVLDLVEAGSAALLEHLRRAHRL